MRVHVVAQHGAISQPASTTQNPDEVQEAAEAAPADWHIVQMCARARSCGAGQVGVNPIRLAGFKRWRPGAPKPVTSAHPATASAPRSSIPNKHSHIPAASYSPPVYSAQITFTYGTSLRVSVETRL